MININKKVITNQRYEDYWKITLEYSDFLGLPFNNVLSIIVNFIDSNKNIIENGITSDQYKELQRNIEKLYSKKDSASTRKSINQFLKLGFINNQCKGYHPSTKKFLNTKNTTEKQALYSKILYENASFSRSVKTASSINEINFLIKIIEACKTISKDELLGIMSIDISKYANKNLTNLDLPHLVKQQFKYIQNNHMSERKYNQRNYLFNICTKLSGVYSYNNILSLEPIEAEEKHSKVRDPYLQRIYKIQLIEESKHVFNSPKGLCVLEKLSYPILIASHIKPYRDCSPKEEFDINNGLLLSKNLDSLFDLGYITFDNFGNIILSKQLDPKVALSLKKYKLDNLIYNKQRKKYMEYHRQHIFKF